MMKYLYALAFTGVVALGGAAMFYKQKALGLSIAVTSLENRIEAYQAAAKLAEDLQEQNEILVLQLGQLQEALTNAEEYDTPLSDVFRNTVERMRDTQSSVGGPSK
jgi:hypothetical protein